MSNIKSFPDTSDTARPVALFQRNSVLLFILIACTAIAYLPVTYCGFIWDDDDYVLENPTLTSIDGLQKIWLDPTATPQYYPLVHTSYWIEYQLWGLHPLGYHLVNVALHVVNALLLWKLLTLLNVRGAWFIAILFAVHPVHVESVAWVTERKNVLSGMFYFLAFLTYWQYHLHSQKKYMLFAAIFFAAALLSKTVTATLPAALAVAIWWKEENFNRRHWLSLAPFFVVGIAFGLLTIWLEMNHVGAKGVEWNFSFVERTLIAGRALWFYTSKLLWPYPLVFTYPRWNIDENQLWQYSYPLVAATVIVLLWSFKSKIGRGPLAAVLLFAGTLFPALGFFDVYPMRFSFVADHFQYLASIPMLTLFVAILVRIPAIQFSTNSRLTLALGVIAISALMLLTWKQTQIYEGLEVLWRATLARNPDSWMAHNNLGNLLRRRGDYVESHSHLQAAVDLKPDYYEGLSNLGKSFETMGKLDEAEAAYKKSIEYAPNFAPAYNGLGIVYAQRGNMEKAMECFQKSIELQPDFADAHSNLGSVYANQGKLNEAIAAYRSSLEMDPTSQVVRFNLSLMLLQTNQAAEAEKLLRITIQENPKDVTCLMNLGVSLARQQRFREAVTYFERILEIEPSNIKAFLNLSGMHQAMGDNGRANYYRQKAEALQKTD